MTGPTSLWPSQPVLQAVKSGEYGSGYTYDERVALIASKVADRNLTEFFTRWGMTLSDGVKDILGAYTAETAPSGT